MPHSRTTTTTSPTLSAAAVRSAQVLVVEDSASFREIILAGLTQRGFEVSATDTGEQGVAACRATDPDVVILDLGLPGIDGLEVCRQIREFSSAYILILSGRDDEVDKLVGLAAGADDYMTKPFSVRELVARVEVLLRRPRSHHPVQEATPPAIEVGDLRIDQLSREVFYETEEVPLTRIEFDLLATLSSRPNMVFTRVMLLDTVWGDDWVGDDHVVDVHIGNLRKKIDRFGHKHIKTVRGVGYRIQQPDADG